MSYVEELIPLSSNQDTLEARRIREGVLVPGLIFMLHRDAEDNYSNVDIL